jgi:hypothetical protein
MPQNLAHVRKSRKHKIFFRKLENKRLRPTWKDGVKMDVIGVEFEVLWIE